MTYLMKKSIFSILLPIFIIAAAGPVSAQANKGIATLQFAGSIGYLSVGAGVTSKSQKFHHELLYGFVPGYYGGPINKLSYKLTYYNFQKPLNDRLTWLPLSIGGMLAYNIDKDYSLMPSFKKYDKDYYWWSSGLRKHLTLSTSLKVRSASCENKDVILYLEANTNDLYLVTLLDNVGSMRFTDIWFLGAGVKSVF
jgi:hypothetical protein